MRWFVNRWPPLPDGRAEILLWSPDHSASLASLGAAGVLRVLELWASRTTAQAARPDVAYVLIFENRLPAAGATVDHPHGQLFGFADVPPVARRELAHPGPCALCAGPPESLVVASSGGWRAWVAEAAIYPYELRIAPVEHVPDLPAAGSLAGAAAVMSSALAAVDRLLEGPVPWMLWVHQRPTDGGAWPTAHLHVHVAPDVASAGRHALRRRGRDRERRVVQPDHARGRGSAVAGARLTGAPRSDRRGGGPDRPRCRRCRATPRGGRDRGPALSPPRLHQRGVDRPGRGMAHTSTTSVRAAAILVAWPSPTTPPSARPAGSRCNPSTPTTAAASAGTATRAATGRRPSACPTPQAPVRSVTQE